MEYLSEEEDLNYNMRREEFEQIIEPVLQKITQAVQKHKADL
jgi:molecular chaperone DnaK (HSP70)